MSDIAVIRITEYEGGSIDTIASSFIEAARSEGNTVVDVTTKFSKTCHCGGHCCQEGGEGCGDEDCICTFAKCIPDCDVITFAFPVDRGFSPTALNRIVHKVTYNCDKSGTDNRKKVFVLSTSESFDEMTFNEALSVIRLECDMKCWDYAGELLIPGLPDACLGADPVSCRKAARLAGKI